MSISLKTELKIGEMVEQVRSTVRVGKPIVVIITKDKVLIDPPLDNKNKHYSYAYGLGYQAGRNDLHDTMYGKLPLNFNKNTKKNKEYQ